MASIYLDMLDEFILDYKKRFDIGDNKHRKVNTQYNTVKYKYDKTKQKYAAQWQDMSDSEKTAALKEIKHCRLETLKRPYLTQCDTEYKRIQYCRYADDFILGVIGSKKDAEKIKADIKIFLDEKLKLELSEEKTKITHTSKLARFLGYDITISRSESFKRNKKGVLKREFKGRVNLYVPHEKWVNKLKEYGAIKIVMDKEGKEFWKTIHRGKLINFRDIEIISKYNSEIRGLYNYYCMANNASVIGKFAYFMEYSMYKTYANKYRTTMTKIINKYKRDRKFVVPYKTKSGMKLCEFYNKGFKRIKKAELDVDTLPAYKKYDRPNTIAARLKRGICELCGVKSDRIRMHHVRKLKELKGNSEWERTMIKMRRKTLAVCKECHDLIHQKLT